MRPAINLIDDVLSVYCVHILRKLFILLCVPFRLFLLDYFIECCILSLLPPTPENIIYFASLINLYRCSNVERTPSAQPFR